MERYTSRPPLLSTGLMCCLFAAVILPPLSSKLFFRRSPRVTPSPRDILLSLSQSEISSLPYPPDALPGGRDVPTPYGMIKVFEFGPTSGERVLLLPGLSTPCLSLSKLADALVQKGYRVMLFDYFGRGWSDTPDPDEVDHDERLYASQIMMAVASSEVSWMGDAGRGDNSGFHVIGYSFGGGLAVNFASWFPHLVRSVTAVAPGGLVKRSSNSWRTRLLYSRGMFPEALLRHFVRRRFQPAYKAAQVSVSHDLVPEKAELGQTGRKITGDPFDDAVLSVRQPNVTVASVIAWQLSHHEGFVPAIMSAMRYGPIYEQHQEWRRLGSLLSDRRKDPSLPGLLGGKMLLVLGFSDSIVTAEGILPELEDTLGKDAFEVEVLKAGHEVAIIKGAEVADAATSFWTRCSAAG
ncbi:hypothetical protein VSDG_08925 [Cytospora chrysosperma]|uniref:AB hydrolase-1 domain-containing protein n=1 Tax=Cytospora chrysosperma TaxID=252740 RepID=A0A423VD24_CYTCH|nr:hypothetical protein VSDG_08925 [Valsa sordida]